ncbi:hypothetical protein Goklo_011212, partial [Gossypium klotzschianum]|nr:hypothetical protein [Gossypium klotzschianum]
MAIVSKALIASLLISLLLFHLVEADHQLVTDARKGTSPPKKIGTCFNTFNKMLRCETIKLGAGYHQGHTYARGHAGHVARVATVFLQELP